ncbi:MAG: 2,3,4,5-tetrahydropyridine-2,6-dicarboxylate N-succinyltransferase [Ignavibacteriae bacterium]|nr:2,3,4,5-tetrahydropyridine-2,6-dicarboxylate N-succinyltransferase [Ignavibacteriota bacterium]
MSAELQSKLKELQAQGDNLDIDDAITFFADIRTYLEKGLIRTAEKVNGEWKVNHWVKEAIIFGFKVGTLEEVKHQPWSYFDKSTLPLHPLDVENKVRLVPGGSSIRSGSCVSAGTIVMPPSYINIGAFIDTGCMIDSHALVGSCAQMGKNVHLSAASQIGGVLEPIGALPVIIEDNVFIGGNCGIYEGTIVKQRAVIGTGVILNASTPVFDNTTGEFIRKQTDIPLTIPEGAVVIAGTRPISSGKGADAGIQIYCPIIIKYRDDKTDNAITLEEALR